MAPSFPSVLICCCVTKCNYLDGLKEHLSFHVGRNLGVACLGPPLMVLEVAAKLLAGLLPFLGSKGLFLVHGIVGRIQFL